MQTNIGCFHRRTISYGTLKRMSNTAAEMSSQTSVSFIIQVKDKLETKQEDPPRT